MSNRSGNNQYGVKKYPPDSELRAAFEQFSREKNGSGLSGNEQLIRLNELFPELDIRKRTLTTLRKRLGIVSIRKNTSTPEERAQALLDIKADDIVGKWGVPQVRQRLANRGVLISRDETRTHLHDHFEHEFDKRMVGSKTGIVRVPLNCLGPWHQLHWDGHEKIGVQALDMGDVGLPIYAGKDQFSTFVPIMRVIPNVRRGDTIGHLFLDMIEDYGCIPLQMTTDKGSEIWEMIHTHLKLRLEAAPEFTIEQWPASVQVQSKHNTPIEGFWRWKRQGEGHSIRESISIGNTEGLFNPNNELHVKIFNWLWPPLVQERLDEFREYWNNHRISKQKHKSLPTGTSPRHMWLVPESVCATSRNCSVRVNMDTVHQLREDLGGAEGRQRAFQFVDAEFEAVADEALAELNYPEITLVSAWDVFVAVNDLLSGDYK